MSNGHNVVDFGKDTPRRTEPQRGPRYRSASRDRLLARPDGRRLGKTRSEAGMRRSVPSGPRGVLEVDWPFFGEICRALALKVARDYQPEIVLGVAKAGVIPGVVVASILQSEFSSLTVRLRDEEAPPAV